MQTIPLTPIAGARRVTACRDPRILLIGPYDPHGGEYTFLAPPLGVWRLAGVLGEAGFVAHVFDPNCCDGLPESALERTLTTARWDIVGVSTTGMTLVYDLALAHLTRRLCPDVLLLAGGMEATFNADSVLALGPFDLAVLGEGEGPLVELAGLMRAGGGSADIAGVAWRTSDGTVQRRYRSALDREALRSAIFSVPYEDMPYRQYWERLERRYRVGQLPTKAEREIRLAEIRSVRLITLNYCPMGCTFCSSTNFLHAAQGGQTARIARLDEHECLSMMRRIVQAHPDVRTIIFQDDIFVFTKDSRILPLCDGIVAAKASGALPADLQFISTNRIDAMTTERLVAMRRAGFRVLGFGVESFAPGMLREFNKSQILPHIEPMLRTATRLGITPFLDMILTSPRCRMEDVAENVRGALEWLEAGCEIGMYPYVIPFSGAAMANDPSLDPYTVRERRVVEGTGVGWDQAAKILPMDPRVRDAVLEIERRFEGKVAGLGMYGGHLPSRIRSLLWIASAIPVLKAAGLSVPSEERALIALLDHLPVQREARRVNSPESASAAPMSGADTCALR
jgi:radical SAM superfamily enzyme YgiQ (UPF0313 family)